MTGVTTVAGCGPIGDSDGRAEDGDDPMQASIFTPLGIVVDRAGSILMANVNEHRIRIIYVNGSVRTLAGNGPATGLTTGHG